MSEVQENIKRKSIFVLKNVILFSLIYAITIIILFELWAMWQLELLEDMIIDHWELGLMIISFFSLCYIIERDVLIFRIDRFNAFMISFGMAWLLGDFNDFLFVLLGITI